jgi:hypothetical protein
MYVCVRVSPALTRNLQPAGREAQVFREYAWSARMDSGIIIKTRNRNLIGK